MKAGKFLKKFRKNLKTRLNAPLNFNLFPFFKAIFILLMVISMIIWIFVGGAFSILIIEAAKQGSLQKVLGINMQQSRQVQQPIVGQQSQQQQPTEANIPGVGKVNIECLKNSLSYPTIKNLIVAESTSVLTIDERTKFEKCQVANK